LKYLGPILCLTLLALTSACAAPEVIPLEPKTPEAASTEPPAAEAPADEPAIPTELVMPTKPAPQPPYTIGKPPPTFEIPPLANPPDPNDGVAVTAEPAARKPFSEPEIEALVRDDLAIRLGADAESIEQGRVEKVTWADQVLTCRSRKGLSEPARTPGYIVTFSQAGAEYIYHTDLYGGFVFCPAATKPLDPIQ